jgi:periplasmic protein TonB
MKPNVKMLDKSKNSFIFFQLGLIAVMVTVLFVLEFNFKDEVKDVVANKYQPLIDETVFVYNPKVEAVAKIKTEPKILVEKQNVVNKFVNDFKKSDIEVNDDIIKETPHDIVDNIVSDATSNENTLNVGTVDNNPIDANKIYDFTESLPMFPACKGVAEDQQKKCFDEQLRKEIYKNLKYPERDLQNEKEGSVFVQFIIDQKGNFTSINPIQNNRGTDDMRKAVEMAVKKLPKVIPAKQGGVDVKIRYTIPIVFKIAK